MPEEAREYVTRGTQLHDEAKYEEALKEYEQAAELAPNWHLPYYEMGYTYWALKEYEPAIRTLQRALELKPDYWLTHVTLGSVLDDVGRREEALPHLERAIELAPDKGKPLYNYAVTLTRLNRLDEAISALQKAEQVEPEYASPYYLLGRILASQDKLYPAEEQFEKFLEVETESPRHDRAKKWISIEVTVDSELDKEGPDIGPYVMYGLRRTTWITKQHRQQNPDAVTYEHTLEEELDVLEGQAKVMLELQEASPRKYDENLSRLLRIYEAGYLPSFVFSYAADDFPEEFREWQEKNPGRLEEFCQWAGENAISSKPIQQRVAIRWMGREWPPLD